MIYFSSAISPIDKEFNFYVQYLIVIDSSVYQKFQKLLTTFTPDLLLQYLKIYYSHIVNGVNRVLKDF
jgi:hypothetical protein